MKSLLFSPLARGATESCGIFSGKAAGGVAVLAMRQLWNEDSEGKALGYTSEASQ